MAVMFRRLHKAGASIVLTGHDRNYEGFAPLDADGQALADTGSASCVRRRLKPASNGRKC